MAGKHPTTELHSQHQTSVPTKIIWGGGRDPSLCHLCLCFIYLEGNTQYLHGHNFISTGTLALPQSRSKTGLKRKRSLLVLSESKQAASPLLLPGVVSLGHIESGAPIAHSCPEQKQHSKT